MMVAFLYVRDKNEWFDTNSLEYRDAPTLNSEISFAKMKRSESGDSP